MSEDPATFTIGRLATLPTPAKMLLLVIVPVVPLSRIVPPETEIVPLLTKNAVAPGVNRFKIALVPIVPMEAVDPLIVLASFTVNVPALAPFVSAKILPVLATALLMVPKPITVPRLVSVVPAAWPPCILNVAPLRTCTLLEPVPEPLVLLSTSVSLVMTVPPLYKFAPLNVSVADPIAVTDPVPPITALTTSVNPWLFRTNPPL